MHIERLSQQESRLVGEALRAAVDGPFFPDDGLIHTLFGMQREALRRIADGWPLPMINNEEVTRAVSNALNNPLLYPHRKDEFWDQWISADRATLEQVFNKLRKR